jgi:branched-chain amino acid transport system ATP-binding protein
MLGPHMTTELLLRLQNINLHYGSSHVLHDVSLDLGDRPLGILGRNGVGKTSICNAIFGLAPITSGQIMLGDEDLSKLAPEKRAQAGLGYVPQGRRIFRSLTVEEHLRILERKGAAWNIERVYETFPRLKERRRNLGDRLSGGEQQMLAISRALLLNPKVLVLDEPTEGLAPTIVSDVINLVKLVVSEGTSVLLVEQNLHAALAAVEDVALIVGGQVIEKVPAETLKNDADMQKKHLGLEAGGH